jgi:hypothetical protein
MGALLNAPALTIAAMCDLDRALQISRHEGEVSTRPSIRSAR